MLLMFDIVILFRDSFLSSLRLLRYIDWRKGLDRERILVVVYVSLGRNQVG